MFINSCELKSWQSFYPLKAIVDKIPTFWHIIDFFSKEIDYWPMVNIIDHPGHPAFVTFEGPAYYL